MPEPRVSRDEIERVLRGNDCDNPVGRGSIIPALALDLRDARAELARAQKVVEAAMAWWDHEGYSGLGVLADAVDEYRKERGDA